MLHAAVASQQDDGLSARSARRMRPGAPVDRAVLAAADCDGSCGQVAEHGQVVIQAVPLAAPRSLMPNHDAALRRTCQLTSHYGPRERGFSGRAERVGSGDVHPVRARLGWFAGDQAGCRADP
jgi:hypothetical protein